MKSEHLVGWVIVEEAADDMSSWSGVVSYPNPTGANIAWENPIKMIEYMAYEELIAQNKHLRSVLEVIRDSMRTGVNTAGIRRIAREALKNGDPQ